MTLESIAASTIVSYVIGDVIAFAYLRRHFGPMGLGAVMRSFFVALASGGAGLVVGYGVLVGLTLGFRPMDGSVARAFAYVVVGGLAAPRRDVRPRRARQLASGVVYLRCSAEGRPEAEAVTTRKRDSMAVVRSLRLRSRP